MKLAFVEMCGFRGYRKPVRIDFAESFNIIDGRNGVGKSTIFDAIEFALTGLLGKYEDMQASRESAANYVWWTGPGSAPGDRYVEVGFRNEDRIVAIRRTQIGELNAQRLAELTKQLCDPTIAPLESLRELCVSTIIRDEQITALSLDMTETERYALLRGALGASDAETWISRAAQLVAHAKRQVASAQQEVAIANSDATAAVKRLDEVRANLVTETVMAGSVGRLIAFADTQAAPDQLAGPVRQRIAALTAELDVLQWLAARWEAVESGRSGVAALDGACEAARAALIEADEALKGQPSVDPQPSGSSLADQARALMAIVTLGREVGLVGGHCPLCAKQQSATEFERGLESIEATARLLDAEAVRAVEAARARAVVEARVVAAKQAVEATESARKVVVDAVQLFDAQRRSIGLNDSVALDDIRSGATERRAMVDAAQKDLRVLDTLRLNVELERAQAGEASAKARLARAQERFGKARKAEAASHALHDASRRAASETLDQRLQRVLPLMSELYRRLRPHPVWNEIEYSIRGDVRRFLKLQVGNDLNPQFLFSSGQRRATGLAFLLSVNLSLAWSRWRSILLDDPVQHIDDFRAVHLAEVAAQLVATGRQVIMAVEDPALADLMCRRLPVAQAGEAKHFTLGPDVHGELAVLKERSLKPFARVSLFASRESAAG